MKNLYLNMLMRTEIKQIVESGQCAKSVIFFPVSLTVLCSFVTPHLNYGDVIYGHPCSDQSFLIIVTRNRKIVWKHRPNWPFYILMLRIKLY